MPRVRGPRTAFYAPLRPSPIAVADNDAADKDKLFARIVCSDAIGKFFGLPRAPIRYSRFNSKSVVIQARNNGRRFVIQDKVGARPFKFRIKDGTQIPTDPQQQGNEPNPGPKSVSAKTISIYVPEHITVFDIIWWMNNDTGTYVQLNGTQSAKLEGYETGKGAILVQSVTTPDERKYNIRTDLFPEAVPIVSKPFAGTPSPSPSPSPTTP